MARNKKIKTRVTFDDIIKATRHGEWQAINECEGGFTSNHKIHNNKKAYKRNTKHKGRYE